MLLPKRSGSDQQYGHNTQGQLLSMGMADTTCCFSPLHEEQCLYSDSFPFTTLHPSLDCWSARAFSSFLHLAERLPFLTRNDESDSKSFLVPQGIVPIFARSLVQRPSWWVFLKYPKHFDLHFRLPLLLKFWLHCCDYLKTNHLSFCFHSQQKKKGLTRIPFHADSNQSWL